MLLRIQPMCQWGWAERVRNGGSGGLRTVQIGIASDGAAQTAACVPFCEECPEAFRRSARAASLKRTAQRVYLRGQPAGERYVGWTHGIAAHWPTEQHLVFSFEMRNTLQRHGPFRVGRLRKAFIISMQGNERRPVKIRGGPLHPSASIPGGNCTGKGGWPSPPPFAFQRFRWK